jgi:radical SAM superfamily enzyme YgiQ (UPF0313 family)
MEHLGADFGIPGPGEWALLELLKTDTSKNSCTDLEGVISWDGNKNLRFKEGKPRELFAFRRNPRRFVDNRLYYENTRMLAVRTSVGCTEGCSYCTEAARPMSCRDPEEVAREMKALSDVGIRNFFLANSEFNVGGHEHALEICRAVRELCPGVAWQVYMTPRYLSQGLLSEMKKAGCHSISFCADSGSQKMLDSYNKNFDRRRILDAYGLCMTYRILPRFDFLIGGPGENEQTIRETIALIKDLDFASISLNIGVRIYPNTGLAQRRGSKEDLLPPNFLVTEEAERFIREHDDLRGFESAVLR